MVIPASILLLPRWLRRAPQELFAAARIDGAGEWTVFWRYNVGFASMVIAASPVLIALIVAQRRFFTAMTAGAIKG